jgi:signal transduction histidine kinase
VLFLHWTAGLTLYGIVLIYWALAPMPGGLVLITAVMVVVCGYVGAAEVAIRRWRRRRRMPIARFYRLTMNGLAYADIAALIAGVHFGGGVDAPALHFCIIPLVVYGAILPQRDVRLHAAAIALLVACVFIGQHVGWLSHQCPPIPGLRCGINSVQYVLARYLSVISLAFLIAYLSSFVGSSLRTQEEKARHQAAEHGLAALRARFVMQASHEFRTPLTVILAASDVLRRYATQLTDDQREQRLEKIQASVGQMTELLEDVLTVGRADSGRLPFAPRPLDLATLCRDVVADLEATAGPAHRITCTAPESLVVHVDAKLVGQILRNLLSNALKYSPNGGSVGLAVVARQAAVELRVSDQGVGIAPADQPHVFEPFYRGAKTDEFAGSGLGLTITKDAVETHGGAIELQSTVGVGTTFTVTLPLDVVPDAAADSTAGAARSPHNRAPSRAASATA